MKVFFNFSYICCLLATLNLISATEPVAESKGFLTIQHDDKIIGNITLGLYDSITPNTVSNFKALLTSNDSSKGLINSTSNRIISDFMAQFGFLNSDRSANFHIFQDEYPNPQGFPDEEGGLALKHNKYQLSMANRGKNTNSCQFFITFAETGWLDGGYVVFGEVLDGFNVVDYLNKEVKTGRGDLPSKQVKVVACGLLDDEEALIPKEEEEVNFDEL